MTRGDGRVGTVGSRVVSAGVVLVLVSVLVLVLVLVGVLVLVLVLVLVGVLVRVLAALANVPAVGHVQFCAGALMRTPGAPHAVALALSSTSSVPLIPNRRS